MPLLRIPLYAASADGNPVDDLDRKELNLYLDNEAVESMLTKPHQSNKVNIIILDSALTGLQGFKKSGEIAENIVNKGLPGDTFIILQLSPLKGFHIIIPWEISKKNVVEEISKLELFPALEEKEKKNSMQSLTRIRSKRYLRLNTPSKDRQKSLSEIMRKFQKEAYYEDQTVRFSYFLAKFKNALRAIEKPKIVFLISGEMGKEADNLQRSGEKYQVFFKNYINDIVKEIDASGSLLFRINPSDKKVSAVPWTRNDPLPVYYELLIPGIVDSTGNIQIEINSERKGIHLYYPRYFSGGKPYRLMDTFQKKLFLLDLILEDPWTRCAGIVGKARFNMLPMDTNKEDPDETQPRFFQINIPGEMRFRKLDLFTIHINPGTLKVDIEFTEFFAKEQVVIPFKYPKDSHGFFVVINPSPFSCIYNEVKWN